MKLCLVMFSAQNMNRHGEESWSLKNLEQKKYTALDKNETEEIKQEGAASLEKQLNTMFENHRNSLDEARQELRARA